MIECNADEGHPCDANDGEPCDKCRDYLEGESAYWADYFSGGMHAACKEECDPEGYRQDMKDAGRGHLLP